MKRSSIALFTAALAASIALACVPINEDLGKDLIPYHPKDIEAFMAGN